MSDNTSDAGVGGGDAWAALVGSLGVMGNSLLSSWLGNKSSKKAQARAYRYWKSSLKEGPALTRQGLEAAGYNPMLALGSVGGQAFSANSTPSFAPVGDMVGGAEAGARLGNQLLRGIKLENEKKELENKNLESDLDTKEVQRLQMEANQSLLQSQAERSDLAYGRDIVDTVTGIAGTGASLYSAKAMADVAKANAAVNARNADVNARNQLLKEAGRESSRTVQRYDKHGKLISTDEISESVNPMKKNGVPSVDSSAKGSRPNAAPHVGSSAKTAGRIAKEIAKEIVFSLPIGVIGAGVGAGMSHISEREAKEHLKKSKDSSRKWYHNFDRFRFDY